MIELVQATTPQEIDAVRDLMRTGTGSVIPKTSRSSTGIYARQFEQELAAQYTLRLYERAGFVRIEPYYPLPDELKNRLLFMELRL